MEPIIFPIFLVANIYFGDHNCMANMEKTNHCHLRYLKRPLALSTLLQKPAGSKNPKGAVTPTSAWQATRGSEKCCGPNAMRIMKSSKEQGTWQSEYDRLLAKKCHSLVHMNSADWAAKQVGSWATDWWVKSGSPHTERNTRNPDCKWPVNTQVFSKRKTPIVYWTPLFTTGLVSYQHSSFTALLSLFRACDLAFALAKVSFLKG